MPSLTSTPSATGVRVRFAPSPTGYLHVGGARTALFNWLYARQHGGTFVLRVEDTDLERSSEAMVKEIIDGLDWLGLHPDEGPHFQSESAAAHREAVEKLLEAGKAYYDFTPKAEVSDADVKQQIAERARARQGQDGESNPYRDLPLADARARLAAGETAAVRLKVPRGGVSEFDDLVLGPQRREFTEIEDLILLRSDGSPLYNLAVVVDDLELRITHVIRGQDHLTNTHKQLLIYDALGAPRPQFGHLPLILTPGGGKLSKRKHGAVVAISTYRDRGFIPEAFVNYLALLGWAPGDDEEIFTPERLIERFAIDHVTPSAAIFNLRPGDERNWTDAKALWLNGEYIRTWPLERLMPHVRSYFQRVGLWRSEYEGARAEWFAAVVNELRARPRTLEELAASGKAFFADSFEYEPQAVKRFLSDPTAIALLDGLATEVERVRPFEHDPIEAALRAYAERHSVSAGALINASRVALTGQSVGPGIFVLMTLHGPERTAELLRRAASTAGAPSS